VVKSKARCGENLDHTAEAKAVDRNHLRRHKTPLGSGRAVRILRECITAKLFANESEQTPRWSALAGSKADQVLCED
jgi:hypothetical protein